MANFQDLLVNNNNGVAIQYNKYGLLTHMYQNGQNYPQNFINCVFFQSAQHDYDTMPEIYNQYVGIASNININQNDIQATTRRDHVNQLFSEAFRTDYFQVQRFLNQRVLQLQRQQNQQNQQNQQQIQQNQQNRVLLFNTQFYGRLGRKNTQQRVRALPGIRNCAYVLLRQLQIDEYITHNNILQTLCQNHQQLFSLMRNGFFQKSHLINLLNSMQNNGNLYNNFYVQVFFADVSNNQYRLCQYIQFANVMDQQVGPGVVPDDELIKDCRCLTLDFTSQSAFGCQSCKYTQANEQCLQATFQQLLQIQHDDDNIL